MYRNKSYVPQRVTPDDLMGPSPKAKKGSYREPEEYDEQEEYDEDDYDEDAQQQQRQLALPSSQRGELEGGGWGGYGRRMRGGDDFQFADFPYSGGAGRIGGAGFVGGGRGRFGGSKSGGAKSISKGKRQKCYQWLQRKMMLALTPRAPRNHVKSPWQMHLAGYLKALKGRKMPSAERKEAFANLVRQASIDWKQRKVGRR